MIGCQSEARVANDLITGRAMSDALDLQAVSIMNEQHVVLLHE